MNTLETSKAIAKIFDLVGTNVRITLRSGSQQLGKLTAFTCRKLEVDAGTGVVSCEWPDTVVLDDEDAFTHELKDIVSIEAL